MVARAGLTLAPAGLTLWLIIVFRQSNQPVLSFFWTPEAGGPGAEARAFFFLDPSLWGPNLWGLATRVWVLRLTVTHL